MQHIGAMLGEGARAGRTGQHASQIEHADSRKRTRARLIGAWSGNGQWRSVADSAQIDNWRLSQRGSLRMLPPLGGGSQPRSAHTFLGQSIFEILCVPTRHRARDRLPVVGASKQGERAFAGTKPAVQMNPAAVARAIQCGSRIRLTLERAAGVPHPCERSERSRGSPGINLDPLPSAASETPEVGRGNRLRGNDRRRSRSGAKSGRDNRIAAVDSEFVRRGRARAAQRSQQFKRQSGGLGR